MAPLYGPQDEAIQKIIHDPDRKCRMAFLGDEPVGILVWKTQKTDEFARFGVRASLEVKTFYLLDSDKKTGKGFGSAMLEFMIKKAQEMHAKQVGHLWSHFNF